MSRYLAWIMNGKYHAPAILRWFEAPPGQRPADLEAVHRLAADLQHRAVRVRLRGAVAPAAACRFNSRGLGMIEPDDDLSHRRLVHDEHRPAALLGRPGVLEFQPDLFLHREFLPLGLDRILRADGDHSRFRSDPSCRKFLRRYVAGGDVHVPARGLRAELCVPAAGQPDDLELPQHVATLEAGAMGTDDNGEAKPQTIVWGRWRRSCP